MLTSLFIENYVLIEKLNVSFNKGLSVLTGETGAGKSIIIGALGLVMGQRADSKAIKQGASKCIVEAEFNLSAYDLKSFFQDNEIDYDTDQCIVRREITSAGKSRSFVNDTPVSLGILKELTTQLIDIHSQHQNLLLSENHYQLYVLDALAGNGKLYSQYQQGYKEFLYKQKRLQGFIDQVAKNDQERQYIEFQLQQLNEANLQLNEQETLEEELQMLEHAEEIQSVLYAVEDAMEAEPMGVLLQLKQSLNRLKSLSGKYNQSEQLSERLEGNWLDLRDLLSDISRSKESVQADPSRLAVIQDRLSSIYQLQQKHRVDTVDELIRIRNQFCESLQQIDQGHEQIEMLRNELVLLEKELYSQAEELQERRQKQAIDFEQQIILQLQPLGIPHVRFKVDFQEKKQIDSTGKYEVDFLFSANKNHLLQPVSQVASGGEISRIMLCIKSMMCKAVAMPTIVFDEIDTGVSGEIADKMGEIMYEMGKTMQVLTITHLPQVAVKGGTHYKVAKQETIMGTETTILSLNKEDRVKEIASMLSGSTLTKAAIENARQLLKI